MERLEPWRLRSEEFVLACWEKKKGKIERNKNKIVYILNINYITLTSNMGPGQVPLLPWLRAGPGFLKKKLKNKTAMT